MSRTARIKNEYGIFYIYQRSGQDRPLFECDGDRNQFLKILHKAQTKFHFKLYAYCVLSSHEYYLILDVNGGDLSQIMKSINIAYAMYVKCEYKLFKDRYISTLLPNETVLQAKISEIHTRYDGKTLFNSYCASSALAPLPVELMTTQLKQEEECVECMRSIEEAKEKLNELLTKEELSLSHLLKNKEKRNQLIKDFRKHSTLTLRELGQLFGDLSESSISKILNQ